jgi:hypothetical protein
LENLRLKIRKHKCGREYNIKIDIKETVLKAMKMIYVVRKRSKCPTTLKMSMKISVAENAGNLINN